MFVAKIKKDNGLQTTVNRFFEPITLNFQFSIFNFQFSFWRSATRRAFRYIFARLISASLKNDRCLLSVVCCLKMLAKDAASIPNALEAVGLRQLVFEPVTEPIEVPNFCLQQTQTSYTQSLLSVVRCLLSLTADS